MKKYLHFYILLMAFASACTKQDAIDSPAVNPSYQPSSIVISYYSNSGLMSRSAFTPVPSADKLQFSVQELDSFYNNQQNFSWVYRSRLSVAINPASGSINQVIFSDSSERVFTAADGSYISREQQPVFTLQGDFFPVREPDRQLFFVNHLVTQSTSSYLSKPTITSSLGAARQTFVNAGDCQIRFDTLQDISFYQMYAISCERRDEYWAKKDTVFLEDQNKSSMRFQPLRYYRFFKQVPGYTPQEVNRITYFTKSAFVCSGFKFQNGDYIYEQVTPTQLLPIFHPALERRVSYSYSADTAQMKDIIALINPGLHDPAWYYYSYYLTEAWPTKTEGMNDFSDVYDWTSASATDSVFTVTNNIPQFKQANTSQNIFEKDDKGRIVKITHHGAYPAQWKEMQVLY